MKSHRAAAAAQNLISPAGGEAIVGAVEREMVVVRGVVQGIVAAFGLIGVIGAIVELEGVRNAPP